MPAAVRELTGGNGADASFEVVGHSDTVLTAIRCLRKGGTVVLIGNLSPKVELPLQEVVSREISVLGSCASSGEISRVHRAACRRRVDVDPLVSLKASLEEAPGIVRTALPRRQRLDESDPSTIIRCHIHSILTGKVAIVTGASRGLGQTFARALARAGADLVITSRTIDSLQAFQKEIEVDGAPRRAAGARRAR